MKSSRTSIQRRGFGFRVFILIVALFGMLFMTGTSLMRSGVPQKAGTRRTVRTPRAERFRKAAPPETEMPSAADKARSVKSPTAVAMASNYVFADSSSASLTDMSTFTTQLIGPDQDDRSSQVTPIGFDFYFDGVRQDRFSVSTNGTLRFGKLAVSDSLMQPLGSSLQSLITAYGADQRTHINDGKVHYKLTGTEGNRVLVVEWLNMQSDFHAEGTADLTYQVRLSETSGAIEFVYGSMSMSATGAADNGPQIGFSMDGEPGTIGSIDAQVAGRSFDGASNAPVSNAYDVGSITVLTSVADGSRRSFMLTPPAAETPGTLTFGDLSTTSMTLNWGDTTNELGYAIYISTDGANYSFFDVAGPNANSFVATGLRGNTIYFWQVYAVTEGGTAVIGNNQTTSTPTVNTTIGTGAWTNPAIWATGSVPIADDAVTLSPGDSVIIQADVAAYSILVSSGSDLQFEDTTARTLAVGTDVVIQSGGTFDTSSSGNQTFHTLNIMGDLINDGTLDFSTNANTAGADIVFSGPANSTFSGTGGVTNIRGVTVTKGTQSDTLVINPSNFTQGMTTVTDPGWLALISGTVEISGTFTMTNRTFNAITYEIPMNAGFWLNNPNYEVAAQPGSANISGLLRISQSTFNVCSTLTNRVNTNEGAELNIEGGTVNVAGRFLGTNNGPNANGTSPIIYNQSGGNFNVATAGNNVSGANNASFTLSAESTFNMSGGSINLVQDNTTGGVPFDYVNSATFVASPGTQGTLQVGTADSGVNSVYFLRGKIPNFVIDNTNTDKVAVVNGQVNLRGKTILTGNATFVIDGQVCVVEGSSFNNNGALIGDADNSHLYFLGGNGPTTYSGTGVVFQPLAFFQIDNAAGVTIDPAVNQIIVTEFDDFAGGLTGSGQLTVGSGGGSSAVVQFGDDGLQTVIGFDVPPVFNLGSLGMDLHYAPEPTGRTTGNEMPPSRTLNLLDISNPNDITIAGGDVIVTPPHELTRNRVSAPSAVNPGSLFLNGGRVITNENTLYFNSDPANVIRSTGYVDGFFKKAFAGTLSQNFEVGTANGYSPVTINITAGTFPTDFIVKANQGPLPQLVTPASALQRYWSLDTLDSITVDITLNYLDIDVPPMQAESTLQIMKFNGSFVFPGGTVDTAANAATINGVSSFSSWTLAAPNSPTAAPATISGVVNRSDGAPLGGVTVNLSGGRTSRTITDGNGQYRFENVETSDFYTVTPELTNYLFNPANRSFSLVGNKTDAVFTATAATATQNPLNSGDFFVRQQYLDFLGREPDQAGWLFWSDQIAVCGADQNCVNQKRLDVSAAFFMSEEFQQSGDYIYRLYRAGLSRQVTYTEFTDDHQKVIGGADLDSQRTRFVEELVQRPEFTAKYESSVLPATFVDALLQGMLSDTQVDLSSQRAALIATYASASDTNHSRSAVLQAVADSTAYKTAVHNPSFVLMEYFGYLRRDIDPEGFAFWVNVLNAEKGPTAGNYRGMVCSFITSIEYQQRFSPIVTRSNADCGK
jgi:hypothetical protein